VVSKEKGESQLRHTPTKGGNNRKWGIYPYRVYSGPDPSGPKGKPFSENRGRADEWAGAWGGNGAHGHGLRKGPTQGRAQPFFVGNNRGTSSSRHGTSLPRGTFRRRTRHCYGLKQGTEKSRGRGNSLQANSKRRGVGVKAAEKTEKKSEPADLVLEEPSQRKPSAWKVDYHKHERLM